MKNYSLERERETVSFILKLYPLQTIFTFRVIIESRAKTRLINQDFGSERKSIVETFGGKKK